MALVSTWRRLWVMFLLIVVLVLLLLPDKAWGKAGVFNQTYFTADDLKNKRLPTALKSYNTGNQKECQKQCSRHKTCDAYAVSDFEGICNLYERKPGTKPVKYSTYNLYVLRLKEEDGYFVQGNFYYRLYIPKMNALDAGDFCKKEGGRLAAVKDDKLNKELTKMLNKPVIFRALIGVSDMKKEEEWEYSDGTPMTYQNWDWNGQWPREDLDCAVLTINGKWRHCSCWTKDSFFCQIPMF